MSASTLAAAPKSGSNTVSEILSSCPLMDALTPAERLKLLDGSFLAYADRGEPLWIAGSPSKSLAIVDEGLLRMTRRSPREVEIAVEIVGPGGCAGLLACVAGCDYPLSAFAVTSVSYLKIPNNLLMDIYEANPDVKDQFVLALAPALLSAFDLMACMLSGNVEQRIAIALCHVADLLAPNESGAGLPVTKQNLADIAGTTVESAIRVTSRWQKEGWIAARPRVLKIVDRGALNRLIEG